MAGDREGRGEGGGPGTDIFQGCTIAFFGPMQPSKSELSEMVVNLGGLVRNASPSVCTHVVSSEKMAAQKRLVQCAAQRVKIVTVDWLLDSIKNKKLLAEGPYEIAVVGDATSYASVSSTVENRAARLSVSQSTEWKAAHANSTTAEATSAVAPTVLVPKEPVSVEVGTTAPAEVMEIAKGCLSPWSMRFTAKRIKADLPPPPVIPLDGKYLSQFGDSFAANHGLERRQRNQVGEEDLESDEEGGASASGVNTRGNKMESQSLEMQPMGAVVSVNNLPYVMCTEAIMRDVFAACGEILSVEVLQKTTKNGGTMPSGRCIVTFKEEEQAQLVCQSADQFVVSGRTVSIFRISSSAQGGRRRSSAGPSSRYFLDPEADKDSRQLCLNCRQPGHYRNDCPNPVIAPCPVCARPGHTDRDCMLSTVCFKCLLPGHMARDCAGRLVSADERLFCTECGSWDHNARECPQPGLMVEMRARCTSCGATGHLCCSSLQITGPEAHQSKKKQPNTFCGNCGKSGHVQVDCTEPMVDWCLKNAAEFIEAINNRVGGHMLAQNRDTRACFRCGDPGHLAARCPRVADEYRARKRRRT
jgi:cellular nucleic acid-binding protein